MRHSHLVAHLVTIDAFVLDPPSCYFTSDQELDLIIVHSYIYQQVEMGLHDIMYQMFQQLGYIVMPIDLGSTVTTT